MMKIKELKTVITGFAGYIIDYYRLYRLNFTNPHSYLKFKIIDRVRRQCGSNILIETGTFKGVTTLRCSKVFDRVYTIEIDKKLSDQAKAYLSHRDNVEMLQGDALDVLPNLLNSEDVYDCMFFLDGHYSGGETGKTYIPEPAIEELKIISNYEKKVKAIIIDDFRSFGNESEFPTKSELLQAVENMFPIDKFYTRVFMDQLIITKRG